MGGHRPPRPPQFRTPCVLVLKTFIQILIFRDSILHSQNSFRCPCKYIQRYHLKPLRSLKKIVLQFEDYICYELPLKFLFGVANVLRMSLSKMSCTFYKQQQYISTITESRIFGGHFQLADVHPDPGPSSSVFFLQVHNIL